MKTTRFVHVAHPHANRRQRVGAPKHHRVASSFADRVALRLTDGVATIACATAFVVLALVSLPAVIRTGDAVVIVQWISQSFLQLVLLSVLGMASKFGARASDARADATWRDAEAILHELWEVQRHLEHQDIVMDGLADRVTS